jgi:hypothetical protein
MRVSLAPTRVKTPPLDGGQETFCLPLLAAEGPRVMLGGKLAASGLAEPIAPRADTLFGPRGACLASPSGPLFICDTGHHRLLVWKTAPCEDHAPADLVIGQPDFAHEGRNAKGAVGAATLNVPTGVAAADGVLAVADAWNHRVLIWFGYPERSNRKPDVVLGQQDFTGGLANRDNDTPTPSTLNWCYGVAIEDGRLFVADTGNRRVLVWDHIPTQHGQPADLVLGQRDFTTRDENAGGGPSALGMRWPHGIAMADGVILVADAGNNRVMAWRNLPTANGALCDFVIGQADMEGLDHNRAAYYPSARSLNMPYGLAVLGERLIVADTANSRLLGFDLADLAMDAVATRLAGQHSFSDKGDNRWLAAARDSLCWPYNVAARGDIAAIADSGNNRVLLWEAAS